jgi:hypothetical protein
MARGISTAPKNLASKAPVRRNAAFSSQRRSVRSAPTQPTTHSRIVLRLPRQHQSLNKLCPEIHILSHGSSRNRLGSAENLEHNFHARIHTVYHRRPSSLCKISRGQHVSDGLCHHFHQFPTTMRRKGVIQSDNVDISPPCSAIDLIS